MRRPLIYRIRPDETLPAALRRNVSWFLDCKTPVGRWDWLMSRLNDLGCRLAGHAPRNEAERGGELRCLYCGAQLEVAADRPLLTAAEVAEALAWQPHLHVEAEVWLDGRQAAGVRFTDAPAAARAFLGEWMSTREPVTQR